MIQMLFSFISTNLDFVYICLPLLTFVYPCFPLCNFVCLCLPLFIWRIYAQILCLFKYWFDPKLLIFLDGPIFDCPGVTQNLGNLQKSILHMFSQFLDLSYNCWISTYQASMIGNIEFIGKFLFWIVPDKRINKKVLEKCLFHIYVLLCLTINIISILQC